jgi:hypothetical protein
LIPLDERGSDVGHMNRAGCTPYSQEICNNLVVKCGFLLSMKNVQLQVFASSVPENTKA